MPCRGSRARGRCRGFAFPRVGFCSPSVGTSSIRLLTLLIFAEVLRHEEKRAKEGRLAEALILALADEHPRIALARLVRARARAARSSLGRGATAEHGAGGRRSKEGLYEWLKRYSETEGSIEKGRMGGGVRAGVVFLEYS